jgi:HIRAN domain
VPLHIPHQDSAVTDFLRRLLGKSSADETATSVTEIDATVYRGDLPLEVVGESRYQDVLWTIVGGQTANPVRFGTVAVLDPEPNNPYDSNAIRVLVHGQVVGYLSRDDAAIYRPGVLRLMREAPTGRVALEAWIIGGGQRRDGVGFLGVFLEHDPADFGVSLQQGAASSRSLRTGLSEALATDVADESYDLSWLGELSRDNVVAVRQLRSLLTTESDPIDRHFMFCELEKRLYQSRDALASALEEFDSVCREHDAEMTTLRRALVGKFGAVPVIEMYRQAVIRCQKEKDWATMRDWAERGIAVYGEEAARPEVVEDLNKRLVYATTKIEAAQHPKPDRPHTATVRVGAPSAGELETLVCASCGATFERVRTRGRKPRECPTCRGDTIPTASR